MKLTEAREIVHERSGGYCEHCGWPLGSRWELHHRLPGGMGGGRDPYLDTAPSNLLALLPHHHNLAPSSVHMMGAEAQLYGWLVSTHDRRRPSEVPVALWGKRFVLLDDLGGYTRVA